MRSLKCFAKSLNTDFREMQCAVQSLHAFRTVGVDGMLVSFADSLSEPANRAALTFRAALAAKAWDGVEACSTSPVSAYVRFDPLYLSHKALRAHLKWLCDSLDWYAAALPEGRKLWHRFGPTT